MKWTEVLQEIRKMRFEEIYRVRTEKRLTIVQAADMLGIDERTFRRWSRRYEEEGAEGLADLRLGRIAHNAAPVNEVMKLLTLFETRYSNFTVAHFYDKYRDEHMGQRSYTWVKDQLQGHGVVQKVKKRGVHRRKRERYPMKGMLLHQDGSDHEWIDNCRWDLIVTMDDADNEIYSAFFVDEEGTWSSFRGVEEVILEQGLFCSLYVDRGSHYFYTPEAGGKVDKLHDTQFGRAMKQLGIELIAAYSPEARGRSERMFGTLQGRLPNELKLEGITNIKQANRFLAEQFIPQFNKRFKVKPKEDGSVFIPWVNNNWNLNDILCLQEERIVNKDNTVSYNKKLLQLPKDRYRYSYHKTKVKIHEYQDRSTAIFYGHRCLAAYHPDGSMKLSGLANNEQQEEAIAYA
jgi:transposase